MISRFSMWSQVHGGLCNNETHPSSPGIAKVCSEVQTSWMLMHLFCFQVQVTQTDIQSWQDSWCVFHKRRVHNEVIQSGHLIKIFCPSFHLGCLLQSRQVKNTPQDSINELIIWKMNSLVVPVTGVKLQLKLAVNILRELFCIWSDWKSLNGLSFLEDIYIKFRKTELVEIS